MMSCGIYFPYFSSLSSALRITFFITKFEKQKLRISSVSNQAKSFHFLSTLLALAKSNYYSFPIIGKH